LTGCDWVTGEPKTVYEAYPVVTYVPDNVRSCPPIPKSRDYISGAALQSEASAYVTQLHRVARTCKARLDAVDNILKDGEAEAAKAAPPEPKEE